MRKFAHLLEMGDNDIRQEGELLRMREEVVRTIRSNRQLETDLDLMDLKIGLLVRNRVTLQVGAYFISLLLHRFQKFYSFLIWKVPSSVRSPSHFSSIYLIN